MSSGTKKMAVLHLLSQQSDPIGLQELFTKLGDDYTKRSIRRWLTEMVQEGLLEKTGEKKGTKYKIIQRGHRGTETVASCFGPKSEKAIEQIRRPLFERMPVTYCDEFFEAYEPNINFYIPLNFRLQLHDAGKRSKHEDPAGTYARQIFHRLLIDLSYNSSRLEGNTYSLSDTKKLILEGKSAEGKLSEETTMILNHKEAIRYLVEHSPRLETMQETICTLHYLLSDGLVEANYGGKVRDHGVRISGSVYLPLENPKELQMRLQHVAEKAARIQDPFEQSFFLLVHISYLQAFTDVNKRTARLCANIPLIKKNLVPFSCNDVERGDYASAIIAIYELQDIQPMLDLYLFSYMRTCAMYDSTVRTLGFDEVRVRYRAQRREILRHIILQGLVGNTMKEYISSESKIIPSENRLDFIEDALEDIRELDHSRIAGLGITPDQLKTWFAANAFSRNAH